MTPQEATIQQSGTLTDLLGIQWVATQPGLVRARLEIRPHHLAPNGYLHAATIIALADTACGFGCMGMLPGHASGFTTVELKANYLGTARKGVIACEARMVHGGRSTQLWDAIVTAEATTKTITMFRCTQMLLTK